MIPAIETGVCGRGGKRRFNTNVIFVVIRFLEAVSLISEAGHNLILGGNMFLMLFVG